MTRVPTTATYNLYMAQMTKQKSSMTDYSYQSTTGYRYSSYDKYGLFSYRLLSLQNEETISSKYLETNSITQILLETQESSMNSIRSSLTEIRSQVREFYSTVLTDSSKEFSEEELSALRNVQEAAFDAMSAIAYYLNTQVDGNYIYGGGETIVPPVDFPYTTLAEFQSVYDGEMLTYPSSYSASLSKMSTSAEVLGGVTIEQSFQTVKPKTTDYTGTMTFGNDPVSGLDTLTSTSLGEFKGLAENDEIVINAPGSPNDRLVLHVSSVSDDGTTVTFLESSVVSPETADITARQAEWNFESVFDPTTGETTNSLKARAGSFSDLTVGKQIRLDGTLYNNHTMTIKSISRDGSTITFEENVSNEPLKTDDLINGSVKIEQSKQEGVISANTNIGVAIETVEITRGLDVDAATNTISGTAGTFSKITGGQTITMTDSYGQQYTLYVKSVSDNGKTLNISSSTPVPQPPVTTLSAPLTVETRSDIAGFITSSVKGSAAQTGDLSFNKNQNTMTATVKNAFSRYNPGDSLIIKGADDNDKLYIVESVSKDGRTIKFSDETPIETEMSRYNSAYIPNGDGVTICKTYSVGATVEMKGTGAGYDDLYTVLGISDDGSKMIVRTENFPDYGTSTVLDLANFKTESYYKGGQLASDYRISATTAISNDVNASNSAFEKVFRALGTIAQGNLLKENDPEATEEIIAEALSLLDKALTANPERKNDDVTSIQYAIITKLDQVKTTMDNQTTLQHSLESYIAAMTQVDKTEAVTMLLQASEDLKVSYSVLSTINNLSLLNYL